MRIFAEKIYIKFFLIKTMFMRIIPFFFLIFLIPFLMNGQDVKPVLKTDSLVITKQSGNTTNNIKYNPHKYILPKNTVKIAGFIYPSSNNGVKIFSLGYEKKLNEHYSFELVGCYSKVGADISTQVISIRPGVKYYYNEEHKSYVSVFIRYQKNSYTNDDSYNPDYSVTGYGLGALMGSTIDISRVVKLDIGVGVFYSYRTPTPRKIDDAYIFARGFHLLPSIHLGFCF